MSYTYTWANAEQSTLKREDADGNVAFVPTDPANRDYAEFLASGDTAADYVAPPAPPEPTLTEKLAAVGINPQDLVALLEQESGVSVDEIKSAARR
jgi:hypothetical protein